MGGVSANRQAGEPTPVLSDRELEILAGIADGLNDRAIAAKLGISARAAKKHALRLEQKLGARNRAAAVTIGFRRGLIH